MSIMFLGMLQDGLVELKGCSNKKMHKGDMRS